MSQNDTGFQVFFFDLWEGTTHTDTGHSKIQPPGWSIFIFRHCQYHSYLTEFMNIVNMQVQNWKILEHIWRKNMQSANEIL